MKRLALLACLIALPAQAQLTLGNGANVAEGSTTDNPWAGLGAGTAIAISKATQQALATLYNTNPQPIYGKGYAITNSSGTVTAGGTFQTLFTANTSRRICYVQNPSSASENLAVFVYDGVKSETVANSISLPAGQRWTVAQGDGGSVISNRIDVTATTNGHAFIAGCV